MSPETFGSTVATHLTIRLGQIELNPAETLIVAFALAAALLSAFYLWRIGNREERRDRLAALRGAVLGPSQTARMRRPLWYRHLGGIVAASPIVGNTEQERLLGALAAAGLRGHGSLASFVATKLCGAVALAAVTWLLLEWSHWFAAMRTMRLALLLGAMLLGWRLPDVVLARLTARRRLRIEQGIPDALDLLVICAESGLSLNQAIAEVSQQIHPSSPEVAEEFDLTAAELRVAPDVGQALDNLAERVGIPTLRGLIATLKQAMRFGTPLNESLRNLAADMRAERLVRLEERAARLPVLLAIPMMIFILPCLLLVVGTPVMLRIMDALKNTFAVH